MENKTPNFLEKVMGFFKGLSKKQLIAIIAAVVVVAVLIPVIILLPKGNNEPQETTPEVNAPTNTDPVEKTYTVAIAADSSSSISRGKAKATNIALVLVLDEAGKIAAARFDTSEVTPELNEDGTVKTVDSVATKVEQGDAYTGMEAGSWADQAKAFENFLVGKTPAEVAALDTSAESVKGDTPLVAGCTMTSSVPQFQALVAEAAASTLKVTFKTSEAITVGLAVSTTVTTGRSNKVTADFAGVVMAGGKVVATVLDSSEQSFTVAEGTITFGEFKGTKNEQGDAYTGMEAGPWYKQAQAFANSTLGKTIAELADLELVSDALAAAGCTMKNTTGGYKTTIIAAAGYAR